MSKNGDLLFRGLVVFATAAALVACTASGSADVHGSSLAKSSVEETAAKQITNQLGGGSYKVTCPHDLAAKHGASMRCVTTFPDGEKFIGTATVTSVGGGKARWKYTSSLNPVG